ncbi:transmembrane protein 135-like [Panonychus citri]|uniref:transmembrane protein 135-like n=1 Tax=Panonychus citri TaxID=50023 RepID=UPI002307896C|nr:transmembrane protein 135-like [Panonychus citri]
MRSSAFLGFNCLSMFTLVCVLRSLAGGFYFSLFASVPATLGSLMAILIEHPSRRKALAFYCANVASECIYRVTLRHSKVKPIPKGEVLIFTFSISMLMYITSKYGLRRDPIGMALKLILGRTEFSRKRSDQTEIELKVNDNSDSMVNNNNNDLVDDKIKSYDSDCDKDTQGSCSDDQQQLIEYDDGQSSCSSCSSFSSPPPPSYSPLSLINKIGTWFVNGKHDACGHSSSCSLYTLGGFSRSFLTLWFGQAALVAGLKFPQIRRDPGLILRVLTNRKKLELCLFASLFTGIYRSTRCSLRWLTNSSEPWHSALAGALSGPTMIYYPSSLIATNIAWKCIEWSLQQACSTPYLPSFDTLIPFIYAVSVNMIFVTLVLEPSCIRPSYVQFLDSCSNHKLHQVNRGLLKLFGTDAHIGYEDFFPDLVPEYCTKKFLESVFVWLL